MIKLVLVGCGQWGRNYVKTIDQMPGVALEIADRNNWQYLIDSKPDGVIIATPPESHVDIALFALEREIAVMVEKPLALSVKDARRLEKYETSIILINNIHLFSPAFLGLCNIARQEGIEEITSCGTNRGPIRDYSALHDFGSHDVSMGLYLMNEIPAIEQVRCFKPAPGACNFSVRLKYNDISHEFNVGNVGPEKTRYFKVVTSKGSHIIYNDLLDNKLIFNGTHINVDMTSPLTRAVGSFIDFIRQKTVMDGRFGLSLPMNCINIIECCEKLL